MTTSKRMPPELLYELVRFINVKQNVSAVLHSSRKLQHYLIPLLIKRKEAALREYNTLVSLYQSFRDNSDMYYAISVLGEKCVYATKFFDQMRHISAQYDAARRPPEQAAIGAEPVAAISAEPVAAAPAIAEGDASATVGGVPLIYGLRRRSKRED